MADFLFAIIELFRYFLRLRRYKQILVEVGAFQSGVGHFERKFQVEGTSPPTFVGIRKLECFLLFYSEDPVILCSFVWIGYQRVTGGRNCVAITALCIESNAAAL